MKYCHGRRNSNSTNEAIKADKLSWELIYVWPHVYTTVNRSHVEFTAAFVTVGNAALMLHLLLYHGKLKIQGLFTWARFTGLARFPRARLTSKSFVKFSMCSYEREGWLGSRDLGKRAGNFAIWTLQPGYRDKYRDEFWRSGWHHLPLPAVFSIS